MQAIRNHLDQSLERELKALIRELEYIGTASTNKAVMSGSYQDQTGNLRSSIGYHVVVDGNLMTGGGFNQIRQGGNGAEVGKSFVRKTMKKYPRGLVLILVAGMPYAAPLAKKGYDVLDSAELEADKLFATVARKRGLKRL